MQDYGARKAGNGKPKAISKRQPKGGSRRQEKRSSKRQPKGSSKRQKTSDPSVSYDEFKEHEGRKYTGMKVGRSHKWYYDQGEWKETKVTPDLWEIRYAVNKRRAGRAPEGSGVPVGTEYHWYVLAHQNVRKLNANDYTTSMAGLKFKIAHKRADGGKWSATPKTQRRRMIRFLEGVIEELKVQETEEATAAPRRKPGGKAAAEAAEPLEAGVKTKFPPRRKAAAGATNGKGAAKATRAPAPKRKEPGTPRSMTKPTRRRRKSKV